MVTIPEIRRISAGRGPVGIGMPCRGEQLECGGVTPLVSLTYDSRRTPKKRRHQMKDQTVEEEPADDS